MPSRQWRLVLSIALGICLGGAFISFSGCGGKSPSGNNSGSTTTTATSVTVAPSTGTVTAGNSVSFTATVAGQDTPSQVVSWSVSPTADGTITTGGAFTASSAIAAQTTATINACSTVPNYTSVCGSATITINPVAAAAPTVTITATPSTISVGGSTTIAWNATNATDCTASGAWSGTQATSGSIAETPSATGTYTIDCVGAGGSATASAPVTVNAAVLPDITSVTPDTIYADAEIAFLSLQIDGENFATGQTLDFNIPVSATESSMTSTQLGVTLSLDTPHFSPGFITMDDCGNANSTDCGTSGKLAFLGAQNYLAASPSGDLYFLDQAQGAPTGQNGFVRKYKADGTADGSCQVVSLGHSIAVDDKTGYLLIDGEIYNPSGPNSASGACDAMDTPNPQGLPSGKVMAVAAKNGSAGLVQPANNSASFYDMTAGVNSQPTVVTASNLGNHPEEIGIGVFGGETDAFVVSLNDTPSPLLHQVRASDAYTGEEPALALTGITPLSTVQAANAVAGGWQIAVFDSGPASGTIAVLSTYDKLLLLINKSTWKITDSVKLSGTPFRIAMDVTNGKVIVAYANPASVTTTYAAVDASSGTVTPLTSTSSLLSVGLAVSADGTKIDSSQRNQMDVEPNQ